MDDLNGFGLDQAQGLIALILEVEVAHILHELRLLEVLLHLETPLRHKIGDQNFLMEIVVLSGVLHLI